MSDIHQFNMGAKSWRIYAKQIFSKSDDNLELSSSNNIIISGNEIICKGNLEVSNNLIVNGSLTAGENTFPVVDGSNEQVLTTDGSGTMYWATLPSKHIVLGSSINAGIYNYINIKDIPNSSDTLERYDFFSVPRISEVLALRTMYLTISVEYNNESAIYQEHIVTWRDSPAELLNVSARQNSFGPALGVATHNAEPALTTANHGKLWLWEDNNNIYVSFINLLNRSHRILIQMKLFNLKHSSGTLAYVL